MIYYVLVIMFVMMMWTVYAVGRKTPYLYGFTFVVITLLAGASHNFSVDYPVYVDMFKTLGSYNYTDSYLEVFWVWLISFLRENDFASRAFFLVSSILINLMFWKSIKTNSSDKWLSLFLFVVMYFYFESLNVIRQYVAIAAFMMLLPWSGKSIRNRVISLLLVLVMAATIHKSALVLLPVILLSKVKLPDIVLYLIILGSFLFGALFMNRMIEFAASTLNLKMILTYQNFAEWGVSSGAKKIVLNALAMLIIFLYSQVKHQHDYKLRVYVNMSLLGIVIYNVFSNFNPGLRVSWYFQPFIILAYPYLIKAVKLDYRIIITIIITVLFIVLNAYSLRYVVDYGFDMRIW